MLTSGCLRSENFGTETQAIWCEALLNPPLSASRRDTVETKELIFTKSQQISILCEGG
jgi:hypothetical protein